MKISLRDAAQVSNALKSSRVPRWLLIGAAVIIAVPLVLVGFFAGVGALGQWSTGTDLQSAIVMTLLSLGSYGGAGFLLYKAWTHEASAGVSAEEQKRALWKVRPEWQGATIAQNSKSGSGCAVLFTLVILVFTVPVAYRLVTDYVAGTGIPIWALGVACLFPGLALYTLGKQVFKYVRHRKYGETTFEMNPFPGEIGASVGGVVNTDMKPGSAPDEGFAVKLGCYRREVYYRGSGDRNKKKVRYVDIWSKNERVQPQTGTDGRLTVPIDFRLPPGMKESTPTKRRERLVWRLDVDADVTGIDYDAEFEIPVFDTDSTNGRADRRADERAGDRAHTPCGDGRLAGTAASSGLVGAQPGPGAEAHSPEGPEGPEGREADAGEDQRKPWTYRDEWADGHIEVKEKNSGFRAMFFGVLGVLLIGGVGFGLIYYSLFIDDTEGRLLRALLLGGPFAAASLGILVALVIKQKRKGRYDTTSFTLDEMPGTLGGSLQGVLKSGVKTDEPPDGGFRVMLTCGERTVRHDNRGHRKTRFEIFWRDEKRIEGHPDPGDPARLAVPIFFEVPDDQPASTPVLQPERIQWKLEVSTDVRGVDYKTEVEVPVFAAPDRTERHAEALQDAPADEGDAPGDEEDEMFWEMEAEEGDAFVGDEMLFGMGEDAPGEDGSATSTEPQDEKHAGIQRGDRTAATPENPYAEHEITQAFTEPVSRGVTMESLPGGGTQFYFGMARQIGAASLVTALCIIFCAILWAMGWSALSSLGGYFVLLFAAVTAWGTLQYWTRASTVTIENGRISVKSGVFGGRSETTFPCSELAAVKVSASSRAYNLELMRGALPESEAAARREKQLQTTDTVIKVFRAGSGADRHEIEKNMEKRGLFENKVVVGHGLSNNEEADWLAEQIQEQASDQARWGG